MPRSEAMKLAQKRYRANNKEKIKLKSNPKMREYMRNHYDDTAKENKNIYYLKTRNYRIKDFGKDLTKLFCENVGDIHNIN